MWCAVLSQIAFLFFGPKEVHIICSCQAPGKTFPIFTLDPHRPLFRLTSDIIFDLPTHLQPFQIRTQMKTKVRNLTIEPSTAKKFEIQP